MTLQVLPPRYYALIPAAGSGHRLRGPVAKPYMALSGKPLLWHTLTALAQVEALEKIYVLLARDDDVWSQTEWAGLTARVEVLMCGGATRADTVRNALDALKDNLHPEDWILVHDAARACITADLITRLITQVGDDACGGLLACRMADTVKRSDGHKRVEATVARDDLWQAQTPQMFRFAMLHNALHQCSDVSDEAGAIETLGLSLIHISEPTRPY